MNDDGTAARPRQLRANGVDEGFALVERARSAAATLRLLVGVAAFITVLGGIALAVSSASDPFTFATVLVLTLLPAGLLFAGLWCVSLLVELSSTRTELDIYRVSRDC